MDLVQNNINIEKAKIKIKSAKPNLSKRVQKVMKHFAKRNNIILTNVEKVQAVVIMGIETSIDQAKGQLFDKHNWKMLQHNKLVNDTMD